MLFILEIIFLVELIVTLFVLGMILIIVLYDKLDDFKK